MATPFSECLTRLRKEAGFRTAYKFFYDNGGVPVLKFTYRKYLLMEQGKLLTGFNRLKVIFSALRIQNKSAAAAELTLAWLRTMAGDEDYDDVVLPLLQSRRPLEQQPLHKAMKRALSGRKVHISPAQLAAIYSDLDTYKCFLAVSNDSGAYRPQELASAVAVPAKTAERALSLFASMKLARKDRAGRYYSPLAGALVEFPTSKTLDKEMVEKIKDFQAKLIAAGRPVWLRRGVIRADSVELLDFFPVMALNLSTAHTYAISSKTPNSGLFAVEGRVVKLLDF